MESNKEKRNRNKRRAHCQQAKDEKEVTELSNLFEKSFADPRRK